MSANKLSKLLHNSGLKGSFKLANHISPACSEPPKEYPPEPPEEPRREAPASEHRHQADMTGLELAGHRLGGAQRHQAGLLYGPTLATEVLGETG
jgi:hypothetical protein